MTGEGQPATPETPIRLQQEEGRIVIDAAVLRLTFLKSGERWVHTLEVADPASEGGFREVAQSMEGEIAGGDPTRVVSPAYQEIHVQPMDEGARLLLTGQSTPHHFSAVLTVRREPSGLVEVEFDTADRCRGPISAFAATYLVPLGTGAIVDADESRVIFGGNVLGAGRLEFLPGEPCQTSLAEAGRRGLRVQALARIDAATATQRLPYRWRWSPRG
ncbi:hypothetical protein [Singulisphaera sp. PoT]|uniref:hypothetical protein n=1 Tax=Singulisphaera sp. PoT TaxID=3411797 RepID=UPI003BF48C33